MGALMLAQTGFAGEAEALGQRYRGEVSTVYLGENTAMILPFEQMGNQRGCAGPCDALTLSAGQRHIAQFGDLIIVGRDGDKAAGEALVGFIDRDPAAAVPIRVG